MYTKERKVSEIYLLIEVKYCSKKSLASTKIPSTFRTEVRLGKAMQLPKQQLGEHGVACNKKRMTKSCLYLRHEHLSCQNFTILNFMIFDTLLWNIFLFFS